MSNIVPPTPLHLIHIHSMHIQPHCSYAVREPVYVMLICTESTFGAKYHGQLAAQRSCQSGLGCPLAVTDPWCRGTVSLWHFNGDFISPARQERKRSAAVLVPTLRECFCVKVTPRLGLIVWDTRRWREDGEREVKSSYNVSSVKLGINIHAGRPHPLETGQPPHGLNPICWTLPLTKSQSLSSALWENKWPQQRIPGTPSIESRLLWPLFLGLPACRIV